MSHPYSTMHNECTEEDWGPSPPYEATNQRRVLPMTATEKRNRVIFGLGIAECIVGGFCVVFAFVALFFQVFTMYGDGWDGVLTYTMQGAWGGINLILDGRLGTALRSNHSDWMYYLNIIMGITGAITSAATVILSGIAVTTSAKLVIFSAVVPAIHSGVCFLGFCGMVFCILHVVFCFTGVCCTELFGQREIPYVLQQPGHCEQYIQSQHDRYSLTTGQAFVPPGCKYAVADLTPSYSASVNQPIENNLPPAGNPATEMTQNESICVAHQSQQFNENQDEANLQKPLTTDSV